LIHLNKKIGTKLKKNNKYKEQKLIKIGTIEKENIMTELNKFNEN